MIARLGLLISLGLLAISADAQVVQLPTFRSFGYVGSVRVPDGGTMVLGGNNTFSSGSARGRGLGMSSTAGGAAASVNVIDHAAIDRRIRGLDSTGSTTPEVLKAKAVAEGKTLVRYARKMRAAGNDSVAKQAYRMAMPKLDQRLRDFAMREFERAYPEAAKLRLRSR